MMFARKKEVVGLLSRVDNIFWNIEDVPDDREQKHYKSILKIAKIFFGIRILVACSWLQKTLRISTTPLPCYQPKRIPKRLLALLEDSAYITLCTVSISADALIMAMLLMVRIQFEMLNNEIRRIFCRRNIQLHDKEVMDSRVQKWIDHHNLLFQLVLSTL